MRIILIISLFVSATSNAEMCAPILEKIESSRAFYNLALKRKEARYYSKAELITLFTVRDRIKNAAKGITKIETPAEVELFSEISGKKYQQGTLINMANFESLVLKAYYNLVVEVSNKSEFINLDNDEVLQAAQIGFLQAIRTYDYTKGMLSTLATYCMRNEIQELFLEKDIVRRYSGTQYMLQARKLALLSTKLKTDLGKTPTNDQLAEAYSKNYPALKPVTAAEVGHLLDRWKVQQESMFYEDGSEREFLSYFDNPESIFLAKEKTDYLYFLIERANLTPRQKRILALNYGLQKITVFDNAGNKIAVPEEGMTIREIAEMDGLSHQAIFLQLNYAKDALSKAAASPTKANSNRSSH